MVSPNGPLVLVSIAGKVLISHLENITHALMSGILHKNVNNANS